MKKPAALLLISLLSTTSFTFAGKERGLHALTVQDPQSSTALSLVTRAAQQEDIERLASIARRNRVQEPVCGWQRIAPLIPSALRGNWSEPDPNLLYLINEASVWRVRPEQVQAIETHLLPLLPPSISNNVYCSPITNSNDTPEVNLARLQVRIASKAFSRSSEDNERLGSYIQRVISEDMSEDEQATIVGRLAADPFNSSCLSQEDSIAHVASIVDNFWLFFPHEQSRDSSDYAARLSKLMALKPKQLNNNQLKLVG